MKSLLAILIGLSMSIAAQAAGFGYDPFAGKSPTSAGGNSSAVRPSGPASQPVKPAPTAPVTPGAQPVKSKQGPNIPSSPAAKN
ncbi:hypothetical protein AOC08_07850 [Polynucleobacter paneuropaeus]|jgi:hypothetical protein|uniref:Proteophosphoglycan ppg4 n=1 Tax=Polynucleobacter paneuropaeus TaxID=2527775 RepID=A0A9Q2WKT5_9BURK|nr:hypothetical protein [Polynucleobacter paneuropaeus]MBT8516072.1 hypothetical protein [Polynucleobacter paneuropaeus]MBT8520987.1 hypothetical protein [Polynucleobacter paneuropaeus]MBT8524099.1 hypothetical protein [Polynucleobacter paneuropaeus]MBT8524790.1 hypothetical protein [Polynucleobacter paneuropaeus]MBT8538441.1 hypothetical protein [Polynucleobacter paneuropaeus]